jgi:MFS family permease
MLTAAQERAKLATTFTFITNGLMVGAFVARIPDIKKSLDISNSLFSICLLAGALGVFSALHIAGKLCAKYGSSPVAFYGSIAMGAAYIFEGFSTFNIVLFGIASFAAGYSLATQDVGMNTHAVTLEHESQKRLMSYFHAMFSVGGFIGGIIGGAFAQFDISYALQCIILCTAVVVLAIKISPMWLPGSADIHVVTHEVKVKRPAVFWLFGIFSLCATIGEGSAGDWGGILTRESYGATPFVSAIPFIAFSATMIAGRFSGDRLASKFGVAKVIAIGALIAVGMSSGLLMDSTFGVIWGWFWIGTGLSVATPLMFSAAGKLAKEKYAGQIAPAQAVALVSGVSYFGFIVGPPLIGFISDATSLRAAMFLPALLALFIVSSARFARSA